MKTDERELTQVQLSMNQGGALAAIRDSNQIQLVYAHELSQEDFNPKTIDGDDEDQLENSSANYSQSVRTDSDFFIMEGAAQIKA